MSVDEASEYQAAITPIQAREMLLQIKVGDFALMKDNQRKSEFEKIKKLAYPNPKSGGKKLSNEELANVLMGLVKGR